MNGHVGRDADGYGGVHGGMAFATRNAEGKRILEFGDAVGMAVCNTFFNKEDSKLITYQSRDNRSMIDYLMVRKTESCLVKSWCLSTRGKVIHLCAVHTELLIYWSSHSMCLRECWKRVSEVTSQWITGSLASCYFHHATSTRE